MLEMFRPHAGNTAVPYQDVLYVLYVLYCIVLYDILYLGVMHARMYLTFAAYKSGPRNTLPSSPSTRYSSLLTMASPKKQTWFITGCSSGFGELFVRQLRALGDNVVATGRNANERLAHLRDTGATILELDVTAPQAELNAKFQQAVDIYGGVDVLVNNAGYIQCGAVEELT
jgi:hypothetical protein